MAMLVPGAIVCKVSSIGTKASRTVMGNGMPALQRVRQWLMQEFFSDRPRDGFHGH